ncbi:hypothetical protein CSAL01_12265 [Colletotrichum salicis]|uniref:Uncharacterized protein n=1 Tax=Colletotrichum salicis TaxID=1209931 RepID=A0A135V6L5_9PEZI|nr:hypothetical protein CSAL01_12265 [Colletotrichum salicis]
MHFSTSLILAATAASTVLAAPAAAPVVDDGSIVINWSLLETHEVIDLGNGVKVPGGEIASVNEAVRVKRALHTRALNHCDAWSFNNKSSSGSSKVSDYAVIRDTGYRHVEYFQSGPCWLFGSGSLQGFNCYKPWWWYGTCIFGANSDGVDWTGGEDIVSRRGLCTWLRTQLRN